MNGPSPHTPSAARIASLAIAWIALLALPSILSAQTRIVSEHAARPIASYTPNGEARAAVPEVGPCIFVDDLDFGNLTPGQEKSLPLQICNNGRGELLFNDPWLTWVMTEFKVSAADIDKLKTAKLGPGECTKITVTFVSNRTGVFREQGKFRSNSGEGCRDISVWTAIVTKPGPFISGYDWGELMVTGCADDPHAEYGGDIYTYNSGDRDFIVSKVVLVGADADKGYFRLDQSNPATTIAIGDKMQVGDTTALRRLQRVIFTPEEARDYECEVLLIIEGTPPDTVRGFLRGRGLASHIAVYNLDFGNYELVEPGTTIREWSTIIKAIRSNRPMLITVIYLDNTTDFSIVGTSRAAGTALQTPFILSPDEEVSVKLAFHPHNADPHIKEAQLTVVGDFSKCDDSVGMVRAGVTAAGVAGGGMTGLAGYRFTGITPNPARGQATIDFTLGHTARTTIEIFDEHGSRVATPLDRELPAGAHTIPWSADGLPAGHYFYRITSGAWSAAKRIEHAE